MSRTASQPPIASPAPARPKTTVTLARVAPGRRVTVVAIHGRHAAELARDGVLPGMALTLLSRVPFGGPTVIECARARLALSADVAAAIDVDADDRPGADPPIASSPVSSAGSGSR